MAQFPPSMGPARPNMAYTAGHSPHHHQQHQQQQQQQQHNQQQQLLHSQQLQSRQNNQANQSNQSNQANEHTYENVPQAYAPQAYAVKYPPSMDPTKWVHPPRPSLHTHTVWPITLSKR